MMDFKEFSDRYDKHLEALRIDDSSPGVKTKAYNLTEADHIRLYGKRKYAGYMVFGSMRSKHGKTERRVVNPESKRKFVDRARGREFESKFNWLF